MSTRVGECFDGDVPTAQSIVDLFEQLQAQSFAGSELAQARRTYGLAMSLFSGWMHPSGKPYVAHCTGTASALAALGAPIDLVNAGLVHAAYSWGDFGAWTLFLPLKRRYLRKCLGARLEAYVHRFFTQPWKAETIAQLGQHADELSAIDRELVLLQLANALDNLRSLASGYANDAERRRVEWSRVGPPLIEVAEKLGYPQLARAFSVALDETLHGPQLPGIRWQLRGVAHLPPQSAKQRLSRTVNQRLHGLLHRVRRGA